MMPRVPSMKMTLLPTFATMFETMNDFLFEIMDAPGEIFDIPEMAGWDDNDFGDVETEFELANDFN